MVVWPNDDEPGTCATSTFHAETVIYVGDECIREVNLGRLLLDWTNMVSLVGPEYTTGELTHLVFWRTCVVNSAIHFKAYPAPDLYLNAFANFALSGIG